MIVDAFDFEAWRQLAERDPEAYFLERTRTIEAFIASCPGNPERLRELQERIDQVRAVAGTPVYAMSGIASLMADRLDELVEQLGQLRELLDHLRPAIGQGRGQVGSGYPGRPSGSAGDGADV